MKSVFISYSRTDHFFAQLAQIKLRWGISGCISSEQIPPGKTSVKRL